MRRLCARNLIGLGLFVGLAVSSLPVALGQEVEEPLRVVVLPDASFPLPTPGDPAGTNALTEPKSPEEKRLQELLKLKFPRSAPMVLEALARRLEHGDTTNDLEQFKQSVISADWRAVGQFLSALPAEHGKEVYRHLLRELPNASNPTVAGPGAGPPQPGPQGPSLPGGPALVSSDVLALADIAPHEIEAED